MSRSTPPKYSREERFKGQRIREERKRAEQARNLAAQQARVPLMDRITSVMPMTHDEQQNFLTR